MNDQCKGKHINQTPILGNVHIQTSELKENTWHHEK